MHFAPDTQIALRAAVALVNSAEPPETLASVADLDALYAAYSYTGRHDRTRVELEQVQAIRPRLRTLLLAGRDEAVELVNDTLRRLRAVPQLSRHDDWDWHIHAIEDEAALADRIEVETAMAMIDVIREHEHDRIGVCADEHCESIALDLSRNRSKRYCDSTCANRNAQAAHRQRLRS